MNQKLKVSTWDVAGRQLETAIRLYFNSGDPVSIHTLACGAHALLAGLNGNNTGAPLELTDFPMTDGLKARFQAVLGGGGNFPAPAACDKGGRFEFDPDTSLFFIFDALSNHQALGGEILPQFAAFRGWFCARYMDGFLFMEEDRAYLMGMKNRYSEDRATYFAEMMYAGGGR